MPEFLGSSEKLLFGFRQWNTCTKLEIKKMERADKIHTNLVQKREWRDKSPATHAESFPRIPVTPIERRSVRIVSDCRTWYKGEFLKIWDSESEEKAA